MFEAHFNTTSEATAPCWAGHARESQTQQHADTLAAPHVNTQPPARQSAVQGLTRRIQNLRHKCPLHAWAAPGKRKDACGRVREHWFLYIEYCSGTGARIWQKLERAQADCSLDALFTLACQAELPGIDSERTRLWLEMHHSR
jgi:hypothetical protein